MMNVFCAWSPFWRMSRLVTTAAHRLCRCVGHALLSPPCNVPIHVNPISLFPSIAGQSAPLLTLLSCTVHRRVVFCGQPAEQQPKLSALCRKPALTPSQNYVFPAR